jgi:hypothetical protein
MGRPTRSLLLVAPFLAITVACAPPPVPTAAPKPNSVGNNQPARRRSAPKATAPARQAAKRNEKPPFDDKDMEHPLDQVAGYEIEDYTKLPNCLEVFEECLAVPFEGKTSEQYKAAAQEIAKKPCRVVLKVVDVPADYDFAEFELLMDDGEPGIDILRNGGDLNNYTHYLKQTFPIDHIKAKGLDAQRLSIGDRVVLVGLGYIVSASPWGASSPYKGVPRGDERQVMLRAFGQPNRHRKYDYEFAFMVRNWYIASQ